MKKTLPKVLVSNLRALVADGVATGFRPADEIVELALAIFSKDADVGLLRKEAEKLTREAFAVHVAAQSNWPALTDCDRLDAAFSDLEKAGIVSRQDFACCDTCGAGEMRDEMSAVTKRGNKVLGYVFYHRQDTDSVVCGYGLHLSYGSRDKKKPSTLKIAKKIVEVLSHHGLATEWNGMQERRISVGLDWKRRLDGRSVKRSKRGSC